jgi:GntR family transcriptional repressor for pyruvate dehydrogenase complex
LDSIRRINVVDAVMEQILACVRDGQFREGERIPSERELTESLNVSRTSLREAIKRLQTMGIVIVRQGDGTYLDPSARRNEAMYRQKVRTLLDLGEVGIRDFVQSRIMLESAAVALVVERADAEDIARLSALSREMAADLSDRRRFAQNDLKFHQSLCEFSRNPVLTRFMFSITDLLTEQVQRSVFNHVNLEQAGRIHREIADALTARDAQRATRAVKEHLERIPALLLKVLEQNSNYKDS